MTEWTLATSLAYQLSTVEATPGLIQCDLLQLRVTVCAHRHISIENSLAFHTGQLLPIWWTIIIISWILPGKWLGLYHQCSRLHWFLSLLVAMINKEVARWYFIIIKIIAFWIIQFNHYNNMQLCTHFNLYKFYIPTRLLLSLSLFWHT